jgi:hypothetical protein
MASERDRVTQLRRMAADARAAAARGNQPGQNRLRAAELEQEAGGLMPGQRRARPSGRSGAGAVRSGGNASMPAQERRRRVRTRAADTTVSKPPALDALTHDVVQAVQDIVARAGLPREAAECASLCGKALRQYFASARTSMGNEKERSA